MTTTHPIAAEKYISLTTYRKSGAEVSTPVWVVGLEDGRIGFWTAMGTGKTKRIRNDPRVAVRPSDARGRVVEGAASYPGTATLVQSGRDFAEVQGKVREKYGVMTKVTALLAKLGPQGRKGMTYADTVVLISLAPDAG
ncbi:PPOX class F420-dependent oxidoreductase [Nocardioides sp.]|uniref:PPOX class F420-dependent oxidoreductase n=1 Tax=Nocardioides sp. TaxID=35761 RepID=UPI0032196FDA